MSGRERRRRRGFEGEGQDLPHVTDQVDGQQVADGRRDVVQVGLVAGRQQDVGDAGAVRRQQLLRS